MMTPVAQALAQPTDIQSRVNFSDGNREAHLRVFYEWLPSDLHDAPGIGWANASSRVLGYCVNTVGQSPDKGYVAFAIGTAIGGLGQASLHQYLCRFYHRLVQNPQRLWDQAPVRLEQHGGMGGICPENCGDAASVS